MQRAFVPNEPIETRDGLYEAILDTIAENFHDTWFSSVTLRAYLPYGRRVDNMLREMVIRGELKRVGRGTYSRP